MKSVNWVVVLVCIVIFSCGKKDRWEINLPEEKVELKFTDLSKEFFDQTVPLSEVQSKYPFFFDGSENEVWERQRKDTLEIGVYDSINKVFEKSEYKTEIQKLFAYYKYYYPKEMLPQVFTYSSGLQGIYDPVIYGRKEGMLFVALDGFLGSHSQWYQNEHVFPYLAKNMTPKNLAPMIVQAIGIEIIPFNPRKQSFVDIMVDEGKKLILSDALLPETSDELKIGFTQDELNWAKANEGDIWNYFVEQNMIFETDNSLKERFIKEAPFSKFLNEIETESPGRIGVWMGWQICRKYMDEHAKMSLQEFLDMDTQLIFKESKYKPKKGETNYSPTKQPEKDEVKKYDN